ncbi:ribonuclease Y [Candidatus Peregrinibacteria bacterium CG11_big_fil_rev_8_21_14_0_20_41_10]|nr:MAG: ribonuclease Y [Candidatus Peregrinibacteria bacterium CG11_big_fil_rev_8_21_14_0_20_41_10]PIZ73294.1 MAG: ribonuclease Y [Candidatus Peregrinibacteria bacterium CG_4_10_14_0_2_um_filter_41_8]PJC38018.1 MAG: ribonuclease Y [Candidatus Peregrinibacteria bacterium CG_4_9_14_0_2_um_filter_41_14]
MTIVYILVGGGGLIVGYFASLKLLAAKGKSASDESKKILDEAKNEARELLYKAKEESLKMQEEIKKEEQQKRRELSQNEQRLLTKEESLDKKLEQAEQKQDNLQKQIEELGVKRSMVMENLSKQEEELERVAKLSQDEAREELFKKIEKEHVVDLVKSLDKAEAEVKSKAKERAQNIIAEAMQKYAAETASESTSTLVQLPSDDMKGRIIGREGRNINTFEHIAGVDVIVDDTPETVIISGFDLVRRYVAKIALERLVSDGRIHPARIEETIVKVREEVEVMIKELGEKAAYDTGVVGLSPELIKLLGRLKFRVSSGQNVLKHSMEVSFLAGQIAAEMGANVNLCKKAGLLHDIGKAVDHEIVGHHAHIGADIAKKFGMNEKVVEAIRSHHGDPEPKSLEAIIVQVANLIAVNRPGATVDNLDNFIKRMEELENVANSFPGVEKSFALHTGALVNVVVDPEVLNDLEAIKLSHELARKIETDLQYQGQVKVSVLREKRVEDIAS